MQAVPIMFAFSPIACASYYISLYSFILSFPPFLHKQTYKYFPHILFLFINIIFFPRIPAIMAFDFSSSGGGGEGLSPVIYTGIFILLLVMFSAPELFSPAQEE